MNGFIVVLFLYKGMNCCLRLQVFNFAKIRKIGFLTIVNFAKIRKNRRNLLDVSGSACSAVYRALYVIGLLHLFLVFSANEVKCDYLSKFFP